MGAGGQALGAKNSDPQTCRSTWTLKLHGIGFLLESYGPGKLFVSPVLVGLKGNNSGLVSCALCEVLYLKLKFYHQSPHCQSRDPTSPQRRKGTGRHGASVAKKTSLMHEILSTSATKGRSFARARLDQLASAHVAPHIAEKGAPKGSPQSPGGPAGAGHNPTRVGRSPMGLNPYLSLRKWSPL